jgi:phage terminase large subunit-like protein
VAYDRWGADQLVYRLENEIGLKFSEFGQGYRSMSTPIKHAESLIIDSKLMHNNNPILKWCISNVRIVSDDASNVKMSKERSKDKIDAAVALVMAIGQYLLDFNEEETTSPYDEGGFFFV